MSAFRSKGRLSGLIETPSALHVLVSSGSAGFLEAKNRPSLLSLALCGALAMNSARNEMHTRQRWERPAVGSKKHRQSCETPFSPGMILEECIIAESLTDHRSSAATQLPSVNAQSSAANSKPSNKPLSRFASSYSGVFAIGDVLADSVKRVASAVGEGSVVISDVHHYPEKLKSVEAVVSPAETRWASDATLPLCCRSFATRPVHPVWWLAPTPAPISP
jgi:hypothetical protein